MQTRQLTRSETNRRIAGVCGGIAEYFGIDALLVRIGFLIAAFMVWGLLVYAVLWIVLPRGHGSGAPPSPGRMSPAVRIAEERYARGEISAEELQQVRGDLTRGT
jgi:phage shock protein PspC (stress-responsive transcriptional regulator)